MTRWATRVVAILLASFPNIANAQNSEAVPAGPARTDCYTLEIHGTRIRLWGVDAPETTQLCRGEDSDQYRSGRGPPTTSTL